ncbi:phosphate/phosphite/phosphonate ABC transporter substrate-binding protein [Thiorhodococcus minor]|uniref:Phosphate/phosphite/phosphonate ABC transporter substrate-binding protein n=2 Tax=Thiorhodococcus minor TaxID=57489 RepID=A0A6M0K6R6_9GAMM|nr:phosphate/phosphite/phosphonate ABC transporter substrate-binding protein [Thiorhodococcus minor]
MVTARFLLVLGLLLGTGSAWTDASGGSPTPAGFRIGVISERSGAPSHAIAQYGPMLDYLQDALRHTEIAVSELAVAEHLEEMRGWIAAGQIDALFESLIPSLKLEIETARIRPRLLVWRKGQRVYRTLFFTRQDSPIRQLQDLRGRSLAVESARSTSAFFLPKLTLEAWGMHLRPEGSRRSPEDILYSFAGSELNQAYWVERGKADAGAFNDGDWTRTPRTLRKRLRIFHRTPPLLRYLLSFRTDLPASIREPVEAALLAMHKDAAGRGTLTRASRITRIEPFTDADRAQLETWRARLADRPH